MFVACWWPDNRLPLLFKIVSVSWLFLGYLHLSNENGFGLTHKTKFWYIVGVIYAIYSKHQASF